MCVCLSLGDVSPISMSPISQSQFIPLGEILCLAISAMNSAHKPVTQDALMEHLSTCFPGKPQNTYLHTIFLFCHGGACSFITVVFILSLYYIQKTYSSIIKVVLYVNIFVNHGRRNVSNVGLLNS